MKYLQQEDINTVGKCPVILRKLIDIVGFNFWTRFPVISPRKIRQVTKFRRTLPQLYINFIMSL